MITVKYRCRRCLTPLMALAELCVSCFRDLMKPCSACTYRTGSGQVKVRTNKRRVMVECAVCQNERYILRDYEPGEKREGK